MFLVFCLSRLSERGNFSILLLVATSESFTGSRKLTHFASYLLFSNVSLFLLEQHLMILLKKKLSYFFQAFASYFLQKPQISLLNVRS